MAGLVSWLMSHLWTASVKSAVIRGQYIMSLAELLCTEFPNVSDGPWLSSLFSSRLEWWFLFHDTPLFHSEWLVHLCKASIHVHREDAMNCNVMKIPWKCHWKSRKAFFRALTMDISFSWSIFQAMNFLWKVDNGFHGSWNCHEISGTRFHEPWKVGVLEIPWAMKNTLVHFRGHEKWETII